MIWNNKTLPTIKDVERPESNECVEVTCRNGSIEWVLWHEVEDHWQTAYIAWRRIGPAFDPTAPTYTDQLKKILAGPAVESGDHVSEVERATIEDTVGFAYMLMVLNQAGTPSIPPEVMTEFVAGAMEYLERVITLYRAACGLGPKSNQRGLGWKGEYDPGKKDDDDE